MALCGVVAFMTFKQSLLATSVFLVTSWGLVSQVAAQALPTTEGSLGTIDLKATPIETIVVTATRTPQTLRKVGASITVIDNKAITRAQSLPVVDLLRDLPGVSFSRNGGVGSLTSVRIRGAEGDQTVLLIDGIKLNDPSGPGGGYDFANLLVGDIKQIDVLRGPQSTLYGSQALGGVINIITRSGDVPFGANASVEGGDLSTYSARGNVRGQIGGLSYAVALGHYESDGISAASNGTEADSFSNDGAQMRVNYALGDALELEARVLWSNSDVGIDGFPAPNFSLADTPERSKTEELIAYVPAQWQVAHALWLQPNDH
jgi:vitamin B12 transporter